MPKYFVNSEGTTINDNKNIANNFNNFFVNVGPKLDKEIEVLPNNSIYDFLSEKNEKTLFLSPVVENEIINITKTLRIKPQMTMTG